jgi:tRNA-specific 2-thiouridylase
VTGTRSQLDVLRVRVAPGLLHAPVARAQAKLRYRSEPVDAAVTPDGDGFLLELDQPVAGIAPGQAAVLYDGDVVVGAGTIAG